MLYKDLIEKVKNRFDSTTVFFKGSCSLPYHILRPLSFVVWLEFYDKKEEKSFLVRLYTETTKLPEDCALENTTILKWTEF